MKNVVLVHGAFADGSGWRGVYDELMSRGYRVTIFISAALFMIVLGLVPALGRLAARIPGSIASAVLAGVLLPQWTSDENRRAFNYFSTRAT